MPTRLILVSDTHVPQRAKALPDEVWAEIDRADVVVHAGDWNRLPLLDEFEDRASTLIAVRGNNDGPEFDDRLPLVARTEIEGVRLAVVHETGSKAGRETRLDAQFGDADLVIFGHSHIPWDSTSDGGLRILNPGSPTDRRREPHRTYLTLVLDAGVIRDVELHRLPTV
ncbi:metallophosphoesterase family protein [Frondihabitans sp. Leaf304]|uniref:metallophosphoesterase family protein n=1 Tax=Frondihabitans sp. Leaf304 TaxID=1736329 RepID=UPI000700E21F|nr:metallophosphoesterase [Frondihabitans sp. Leaf304]KQQ25851.1 phosphodiesterase [Frondihabitans sp. Leaf304]